MNIENILQNYRKPFKERKNFDLEKIKVLLELLDNPQNSFVSIHIAGTNGKGSVSAMLSSVLVNLDLKVGLFTSPHLERFTERIKINDLEIKEEDFLKIYYEKIIPVINKLNKNNFDHPTEFEVITLITFCYFKEQSIDIAVVESGLGGRFDATNIINNLALSIITNISLDHTDRLGNDIRSVTYHKAGIIKSDIPVVITSLNTEKDIFCNEVKDNNQIYFTDNNDVKALEIIFDNQNKLKRKYLYCNKDSLFYNSSFLLNLVASYQKENLSLVLKSLDILYLRLQQLNLMSISKKDYILKCISGLENAQWFGRFEYFNLNGFNLILDGAHNDNGMKLFVESLKDLPQKIIICIFACNKDKDYTNMINYLAESTNHIIVTKSHVEIKAKDPQHISDYLKSINKDHKIVKDYRQTIEFACKIITDRNYDKKNVLICVCGSLYLVGGIREQINKLYI